MFLSIKFIFIRMT